MMGHRHITTTERHLHYTLNPEALAELAQLWGERGGARDGVPMSASAADVIPLRSAA
jgi:hypothetical protein